jgi:hypothetical protein
MNTVGGPCTATAPCCGALTCGSNNTCCVPSGFTCSGNADCCSGSCASGTCA